MNTIDDLDRDSCDDIVQRFSHIRLDRPCPKVEPAPARPHRRRWLVAAAAVVVVGVAVAAWPTGSDHAYAGWTPTPRAAAPGEMDEVLEVCNARAPVADLPPGLFEQSALIEFRGDVALVIARQAASIVRCTARMESDGWYAFGIGEMPLIDAQPVLVGGGGADAMTWLLVGVDQRADRVDLVIPGFETVAATVVDGAYTAWWPADRTPDDEHVPKIRVEVFDAAEQLVDVFSW